MKTTNKNKTEPGQAIREVQLRRYARRMLAVADLVRETILAIEDCGTAEIWGDPSDPLAGAAGQVGGLERLVSAGRRFAEADGPIPAPRPALARELRTGADRLSGALSRLIEVLDRHRMIWNNLSINVYT
jgi:hypothetical protein